MSRVSRLNHAIIRAVASPSARGVERGVTKWTRAPGPCGRSLRPATKLESPLSLSTVSRVELRMTITEPFPATQSEQSGGKRVHHLISADSHINEPADLWTSRVAAKWRDRVP